MNREQLQKLLDGITYKEYLHWTFRIAKEVDGGWLIQHTQLLPDCEVKRAAEMQSGRKWYISQHMTESEVLQTALLAVLTFEEHEARECFRYQGKQLYGPHIDISQTQTRDVVMGEPRGADAVVFLSCPFCGSTELLGGSWYLDDEGEVDAVECSKCFAGAPAKTWNNRHATVTDQQLG